jgi:hypothetical protein
MDFHNNSLPFQGNNRFSTTTTTSTTEGGGGGGWVRSQQPSQHQPQQRRKQIGGGDVVMFDPGLLTAPSNNNEGIINNNDIPQGHSEMLKRLMYSESSSNADALNPRPIQKKGTVPCRFFNTPQGCRFGAGCSFLHEKT